MLKKLRAGIRTYQWHYEGLAASFRNEYRFIAVIARGASPVAISSWHFRDNDEGEKPVCPTLVTQYTSARTFTAATANV